MSTVFVTLCDAGYFDRAQSTIREVRESGKWEGDIVLVTVDFDPGVLPGIEVHKVSHINTENVLSQLLATPIKGLNDNRHLHKLYQWDKLQIFTPFFRRWERVVFLDAGIRLFNDVKPLLDLEWRGRLVAPDDAAPGDNGNRFGVQLDMVSNPAVAERLISIYGENILRMRYFLNCMFLYDTALLEQVSYEDLEEAMNAFPIVKCNEMTIMNLLFTFKLNVWSVLPEKAGDKYLFAWSERNYPDSPHWSAYHFVKYYLS